ncbi:hypothetical protein CLIB1423_16S03378 [[Candida] railenensis]|uniref:RRM domain-containing protein n=1 Tax=[Candida] railenensis TaxID=45579 RepID=A0A9P0VZ39_9ASCO|nr:hypothetical protein CLIB1423_16S03378 [[Candida] railenensis]
MSLGTSAVIYLGSIPYEWDENAVKAVVSGSGRVVDVRLGFDYAGKNKGFCFIEYATPQDAQNALRLLNQVQIAGNQGAGPIKRLRIELSKEGLRSNGQTDMKPVLNLDKRYLPPFVYVPPEMSSGDSNGPGTGGAQGGAPGFNGMPPAPIGLPQAPTAVPAPGAGLPNLPRIPPSLPQNPNMQQQRGGQFGYNKPQSPQIPQHAQMQQQPQIQQQPTAPQYQQGFQNTPTPPQIHNTSVTVSQMPTTLTAASQTLPQPNTLPFSTPDKINETLSKIPPVQLIELIANLKNILGSPNAARAVDVFQLSPDLASSAAQALLIMGLIDEDVIANSMKATPPPTDQQQQSNHYGQQQGQHQPTPPPPPSAQTYRSPQPNNRQPYGGTNSNFGIPPPPPQSNSKWPNLPQHTQAKLANMAPDQADLIAQVLSISPDQIVNLPPDKQTMITNIRSQYL